MGNMVTLKVTNISGHVVRSSAVFQRNKLYWNFKITFIPLYVHHRYMKCIKCIKSENKLMKNVELNLTSNIFEDLFKNNNLNKILNKISINIEIVCLFGKKFLIYSMQWTILFVNRSLICINIYIYEYFIFHYI